MKEYLATYIFSKEKPPTTGSTTVMANTSSEALQRVRMIFGYQVSHIQVEEATHGEQKAH